MLDYGSSEFNIAGILCIFLLLILWAVSFELNYREHVKRVEVTENETK